VVFDERSVVDEDRASRISVKATSSIMQLAVIATRASGVITSSMSLILSRSGAGIRRLNSIASRTPWRCYRMAVRVPLAQRALRIGSRSAGMGALCRALTFLYYEAARFGDPDARLQVQCAGAEMQAARREPYSISRVARCLPFVDAARSI
jgi:hypothetical protein